MTTPCDLDKINQQNQVFPCEGVSFENSKWRLYSWIPESNKPLQLLRSDLPKHVVFNPMDKSQTAWPGPGVVCLGDLNKTGGITCIPLPKIKNVKENAWNQKKLGPLFSSVYYYWAAKTSAATMNSGH
ncbi:MAG: hypothetical protein GY729_20835 [Desulfobacteraceae bacterium]|nr:hypothetical protein [Desulfobacteraceae bacterium]